MSFQRTPSPPSSPLSSSPTSSPGSPTNLYGSIPARYQYNWENLLWDEDGEPIGSGGYADVHEVSIVGAGPQQKIVAGKVFRQYLPKAAVEEFENMLKLEHRTVIQPIGISINKPTRQIIILTELAKCSLADMIRHGRLQDDPQLTCQLMLDVVAGLSWLHSKVDERQHEVALHLDLKPSNILVVEQEEHRGGLVAKLADLGSCRQSDITKMTQTSFGHGTAQYMAPEQWDGSIGKLSSATDVYSLCVILWEILSGQQPFAGLSPSEIMCSVVGPERRHPLAVAAMRTSASWNDNLVSTIAAGISIDPSVRCNLGDLRMLLARQLTPQGNHVRPPTVQQFGQHAPNFESVPLPTDMVCVVCMDPMYQAFNLSPCNHKVCEECANRLVGLGMRCPHCNEFFAQATKDHTLSSIIRTTTPQVRCLRCDVVLAANLATDHRCQQTFPLVDAAASQHTGTFTDEVEAQAGSLVISPDVDDSEFKQLLMDMVSSGVRITDVDCRNNISITDASIELVAQNCPKLVRLDVGLDREQHKSGNVTDKSMKAVAANCLALQALNVSYTYGKITDESIKLVATNCLKLQTLDVRGTDGITDKSMKIVGANCGQLQVLDVSHTKGKITNDSLKRVAAKCRQLQKLDVSWTKGKITDESMKLVATNCSQLHALNVSGTEGQITDESMQRVAASCRQLQTLDVTHTYGKMTDTSMKLVATNCIHLQVLDFSWIDGITDESMKVFATSCQQLKTLDVSGTDGITDDSMKLVAANCPHLHVLDVSWTKGNITDESMKLVVSNCQQLQSLTVRNTKGKITDESMKLLATNCRQLQKLDVRDTEGTITVSSLLPLIPTCVVLQ